ncbi:DUF177 domain-containing protein [Siculibacillus lacustris]|uniref:DUF177 domain-containing protein n=1 Tax=Siculibacillus lacustris TaxID=1549641 RepID=A0A4Q9VUA4_9HYPH|nr:DUF177 domain-containing protein [Siculibacillus lacustris]TBW39713.1 DUF177 domain-containing protein [Siculibacillus lacustris]
MTDAPVPAPAPVPLRRTLSVSDISPGGTHVVITADAEQLAALAVAGEVLSVEFCRAELRVAPWSGAGVAVDGRVTARLTQACIVTLEPVETLVDEEVSVRLVPPDKLAQYLEPKDDDGAIDLDANAIDVPEPLEGGTVDLGAIVVEHLMLGIDPYPRRPGAEFDPVAAGLVVPPETFSPFAALARRKKE